MVDNAFAEVTRAGRLFQRRGAATPKARSPGSSSRWQSRPTHDQFVGRSWPQSRSRAVICCPLQIFRQILRCCLVLVFKCRTKSLGAALEHQNGQSKVDSFRDSQLPVKFLKQRSLIVQPIVAQLVSRTAAVIIDSWCGCTIELEWLQCKLLAVLSSVTPVLYATWHDMTWQCMLLNVN